MGVSKPKIDSISTSVLLSLHDDFIEHGAADTAYSQEEIAAELVSRHGDELHRARLKKEIWDKLPSDNRYKKGIPKKTIIAIAVAVSIIVFSVAAIAAIPEWFSNIFGSGTLTAGRSGDLYIQGENLEYHSLDEALAEYGVSNLSPSWIPERFSLAGVELSDTGSTANVLAWYSDDSGGGMSVIVSILQDDDLETFSNTWEIDDNSTEIKIGGITHYLDSNMSVPTMMWEYGNCVCSVSGDLTESELKKIVKSIYD